MTRQMWVVVPGQFTVPSLAKGHMLLGGDRKSLYTSIQNQLKSWPSFLCVPGLGTSLPKVSQRDDLQRLHFDNRLGYHPKVNL